MESNLQGPLRQLSRALHRALAASLEVEDALQRVRDAGYDASVALEVTIALARRDEAADGLPGGGLSADAVSGHADAPAPVRRGTRQPVVLRWAEAPIDSVDAPLFEILGESDADEEPDLDEPQAAGSWAHEMGQGDRDYLRALRIRIDE